METVGDKYMAVSGLPEPCEDHVRCIARLALDMMDLSHTVVVDGVPVVSIFEIITRVLPILNDMKTQCFCGSIENINPTHTAVNNNNNVLLNIKYVFRFSKHNIRFITYNIIIENEMFSLAHNNRHT